MTVYRMSRLKKKLLLYFILISIVSISVSAEIIFEMSSPRFQKSIEDAISKELAGQLDQSELASVQEKMDTRHIFEPVINLRNRMILLLIVVSVSIIGSFFLFARDIVTPMDGMVEATKKIAEGDLTVTVPVMSEDEIGQVAGLINDMNVNLQDMIMQIRQEITRHMEQIIKASFKMGEIIREDLAGRAFGEKKISMKEFRTIMKIGKDVFEILENMSGEMFALQKFVNMYKTYGGHSDILQDEIDSALESYSPGITDGNRNKQ